MRGWVRGAVAPAVSRLPPPHLPRESPGGMLASVVHRCCEVTSVVAFLGGAGTAGSRASAQCQRPRQCPPWPEAPRESF